MLGIRLYDHEGHGMYVHTMSLLMSWITALLLLDVYFTTL